MCDYISEMIHPLDQSFKILGRRWASPVLLELLSGKNRFNVLLGALPGVSPKTLSARLQDFQRSGLVERQELETRPKQVRYALTEKGEEFRLGEGARTFLTKMAPKIRQKESMLRREKENLGRELISKRN